MNSTRNFVSVLAIFLLIQPLQARFFLLPKKDENGSRNHSVAGFRVGGVFGRYSYHLSGPEIYMWRVNHGYSDNRRILDVSDKFGSLQNFHGLSFYYEGESDLGITYELGWTMRRNATDAKYTYDTGPNTAVSERSEKVKISISMVFLTVGYRPKSFSKTSFGLSMDIGMLKTKIKIEDAQSGNGKWQPWFYSYSLFGNNVKPGTPIAAYGVHVSQDISSFTLRLTYMRGILNGDLLSETKKYTNIPFSSKMFPVANTSLALYYHF